MRAEDRLAALALLYADGFNWILKTRTSGAPPVPVGGINACDQVDLARPALLALLPPVVALPCAAHDTNRDDCPGCKTLLLGAQELAVLAAFNRLGLRHPWLTRSGRLKLPGGRRPATIK